MSKGFDSVKERQWRDVLRRQKRSGLSIRGFCEQESISEARFHWWRRELARRSAGSGASQREIGRQRSSDVTSGRSAVTLLPLEVAAVSADAALEIVLPSGVLLRVRLGADARLLCDVLSALEGRPC